MLLQFRRSIVAFPAPIFLLSIVGLVVLLLSSLIPSPQWNVIEQVTGVLFLLSLVDCFFRVRICTYRAPDIICRTWNTCYRGRASDAWMSMERDEWTRLKQSQLLLYKQMTLSVGLRVWESWKLSIHVAGVTFKMGTIAGGDTKNALIPIANILHIPVKNAPLPAINSEQKIYDRLKILDYGYYALILIFAVPLLVYLLLTTYLSL